MRADPCARASARDADVWHGPITGAIRSAAVCKHLGPRVRLSGFAERERDGSSLRCSSACLSSLAMTALGSP